LFREGEEGGRTYSGGPSVGVEFESHDSSHGFDGVSSSRCVVEETDVEGWGADVGAGSETGVVLYVTVGGSQRKEQEEEREKGTWYHCDEGKMSAMKTGRERRKTYESSSRTSRVSHAGHREVAVLSTKTPNNLSSAIDEVKRRRTAEGDEVQVVVRGGSVGGVEVHGVDVAGIEGVVGGVAGVVGGGDCRSAMKGGRGGGMEVAERNRVGSQWVRRGGGKEKGERRKGRKRRGGRKRRRKRTVRLIRINPSFKRRELEHQLVLLARNIDLFTATTSLSSLRSRRRGKRSRGGSVSHEKRWQWGGVTGREREREGGTHKLQSQVHPFELPSLELYPVPVRSVSASVQASTRAELRSVRIICSAGGSGRRSVRKREGKFREERRTSWKSEVWAVWLRL
jgi:hypothetical protein